MAEEVRQIMAQLGIRRFDDLIGRADLLEGNTAILQMYKDEIVGVELPASVELEITFTRLG